MYDEEIDHVCLDFPRFCIINSRWLAVVDLAYVYFSSYVLNRHQQREGIKPARGSGK